jgi:hypothetical protein
MAFVFEQVDGPRRVFEVLVDLDGEHVMVPRADGLIREAAGFCLVFLEIGGDLVALAASHADKDPFFVDFGKIASLSSHALEAQTVFTLQAPDCVVSARASFTCMHLRLDISF